MVKSRNMAKPESKDYILQEIRRTANEHGGFRLARAVLSMRLESRGPIGRGDFGRSGETRFARLVSYQINCRVPLMEIFSSRNSYLSCVSLDDFRSYPNFE